MPKRTSAYRDRLLRRLAVPEEAANYLNAAKDDSLEIFLEALKDVAQARQMSAVAQRAGVKRETIYKAFSKKGNPTLETLDSVLSVLGLQIRIAARTRSTPVRSRITGNIGRGKKKQRKAASTDRTGGLPLRQRKKSA
jgi:probable addiction module antidote protein